MTDGPLAFVRRLSGIKLLSWTLVRAASGMVTRAVSVHAPALTLKLVSAEKMLTSQKNILPNWQPC